MSTELNQERVQEYGGKMLEILNHGALSLQISIGHRTGLFDCMSTLGPSTSAQIAKAAGLNERYVREWLGTMATSRMVQFDAEKSTYLLPPELAPHVTRAGGPGNMAMLTQYFAEFGKIEDQLLGCFKNGGGVPYSAYTRFQAVQREETAQLYDLALVGGVLPMVEGLTAKLEAGADVLDVGCGGGHAINVMAQAFPRSRFVGYDISDEGIAAGRAEAAQMGLKNARFEVRDAASLEGPPSFDFVLAWDTIHDQAKPDRVLRGIHQSVKPGGDFLMVDIAASSHLAHNMEHPLAPALYTVSTFHCMTVSLAHGGPGLGACWGEEKALEMLAAAGFSAPTVKKMEGDLLNNYYVCKRACARPHHRARCASDRVPPPRSPLAPSTQTSRTSNPPPAAASSVM
jgi:2-polyprenyl-3-methyl-5-hydroxy-6-metoxy-1,4-benzoquinol methylase